MVEPVTAQRQGPFAAGTITIHDETPNVVDAVLASDNDSRTQGLSERERSARGFLYGD